MAPVLELETWLLATIASTKAGSGRIVSEWQIQGWGRYSDGEQGIYLHGLKEPLYRLLISSQEKK